MITQPWTLLLMYFCYHAFAFLWFCWSSALTVLFTLQSDGFLPLRKSNALSHFPGFPMVDSGPVKWMLRSLITFAIDCAEAASMVSQKNIQPIRYLIWRNADRLLLWFAIRQCAFSSSFCVQFFLFSSTEKLPSRQINFLEKNSFFGLMWWIAAGAWTCIFCTSVYPHLCTTMASFFQFTKIFSSPASVLLLPPKPIKTQYYGKWK